MLAPEFFKAEFWHVPDREPLGDKAAEAVYLAVGRSLSQWEQLEIALGQLFTVLAQSRSQAAFRVYGNFAAATSRYDALDLAAEIYFHWNEGVWSHYKTFNDLLKIMRWAAPRRNDIAHGHVVIYAMGEGSGYNHYLVPADYNSRRMSAFVEIPEYVIGDDPLADDPFTFTKHKYAYTSGQIASIGDRFPLIQREVENLARALSTLTPTHLRA